MPFTFPISNAHLCLVVVVFFRLLYFFDLFYFQFTSSFSISFLPIAPLLSLHHPNDHL